LANRLYGDVLRPAVGGARLLYENTLGTPGTASSEYETGRDEKRALLKAAQEQHPGALLGSEIVGSLAAPIPGLTATSLGGRTLQGAGLGAGFGALAGAGEGEDLTGRLKGAGVGGALGGVLGGAAPTLVEGALALGQRAVAPFRSPMSRVAGAVGRDIEVDPQALNRMTQAEVAATPTAATVDLGGEATRSLARSAANTSPEARLALNQTLDPRYEAQSDRVTGWLNNNFGFPSAQAEAAALESSKRAANPVAYNQAYAAGAAPFATPEMARLGQSDAVQAAMKRATSALQDEAVISGNKMQPYSLEYWDLVRRELSDGAKKAGYDSPEGRRLSTFAKTLNQELDKAVPEYQAARAGAKSFFESENALEAGQNFVRLNKGLDEAKTEIAKMSATDRTLFQKGFVSRYVEELNRIPDRRNVLNRIAESPVAQEKLNIALGPQKAAEMEALMRIEGLMNKTRETVNVNATHGTARQLVEMGLAGGGVGFSAFSGDPKHAAIGLLSAALSRGQYKINAEVSKRVGQLLASKDPKDFQQVLKMAASNRNIMGALRSVDKQIARAGGEQTQ
jgi:hypothetical protein